MIYNVFLGLAIGVVISIFIVGFLCIMIIAGREDKEDYRTKKKSKKGKNEVSK